jgi:hypothetical protein
MKHIRKESIAERDLTVPERTWISQILRANQLWSGASLNATRVVGKCACGECRTVYLESPVPQNPQLQGTRGYVGRIDIRTTNGFGITVTLDQIDGKLFELYINHVDPSEDGNRTFPENWEEAASVVEPM